MSGVEISFLSNLQVDFYLGLWAVLIVGVIAVFVTIAVTALHR